METKIKISKNSKKTGQFSNIEDAIHFKNEELLKVLKIEKPILISQK
jgi:hypothetical protein